MARRGFFRRIFDAVQRIFTAPPARPPEREPEEPDLDDRMRQAWRDETRSRLDRNFERHLELFGSIPGIELESDDEREYLWRSYIENMVRGTHRRNDPANPWWADIGLDPRDFDWAAFREAIDSP